MFSEGKIWIASGGEKKDKRVYLYPNMANRHGLITGASGTGKTVTLRVLAESFSDAGVPVFMSDVKGDLGGLCQDGDPGMVERAKEFGADDFILTGFPVRFWDVYGESGTPVRATVSSMGAPLLSRLMGLTDVQADVLNIIFRIARDKKWNIVDSKDLRALLTYMTDHREEYEDEYGLMSSQSLGAVLRAVRSLEDSGGNVFFGEPALDIEDWIQCGVDGRGYINVLNASKLSRSPMLYATFMLWLMQQLFDRLPEAGDLDMPKMVFFFDEAHMLFSDAPKELVQKVEQTVKLIRSKGVGIYFVTQSPSDIPDSVLAQLSNRVQHALRAYTPAEQKAVRAAATAFRPNPAFKTEDVITELGTGEALVSCLDAEGRPSVVERASVLPPQSRLGALDPDVYARVVRASPFEKKYRDRVDSVSAYERVEDAKEAQREKKEKKEEKEKAKEEKKDKKRSSKKKSVAEKAATRAATSFASSLGSALARRLFKK